MTHFRHQPVLLAEAVDLLRLRPGMTIVDCTVGGGGHSRHILEKILPSGFLVGIDRDPQALAAAEENLGAAFGGDAAAEKSAAAFGGDAGERNRPYLLVHSNFSRIRDILAEARVDMIDGALMDLGVSSYQLDEGRRGFSYQRPGNLDMRMDPTEGTPTAFDVVMYASAEELERIFRQYGEERWSRRIAGFIVKEREQAPIETTEQLTAVIKKAVPAGAREEGPHPSRRVFQALRIFINGELEVLEGAIRDTVETLAPGGRLAVITFHSLEDRIVKDTMKALAAGCTCPKDFPVCVCGKTRQGVVLTKKPILPGLSEIGANPRSRSAKLRGFEKSR